MSLAVSGRPREGLVLLRGAHQLALANELGDVELGSRVLLTFYEQWGEPAAGLALGREGLEIGRRLGSRVYGFQMVGNSVICALRVGEWDWAGALLEEWLDRESEDNHWIEFHVDRALLHAQRGLDPSADIEIAARRRAGVTDPQFESYERFARAVAALASGDLEAAVEHADRSATITDYFTPLAIPVAARAALWAGDAATARRLLEVPATARFWGPVLEADWMRIRAGIAALEGRTAEAISLFRDAIRSYRALDLAFEAAMVAIDVATVLPARDRSTPEIEEWIAAGGRELDRLGASPYIARLAETLARQSEPPPRAGGHVAAAARVRQS